MYTIIGGNPFTGYTGTTTFTGLRVVGRTSDFKEMESIVKQSYEECSGLILVLFNGEEVKYDDEGRFIEPK